MHSNPLGPSKIKIPFVENYKECTICAILRENTLFCLAATEAKTCCAMLRRGPKIMQIPPGDQKTIFIAQKACDFVGKVEISLYSKNHFGAMLIGFGNTQLVDTFLGKNQVLKVNCSLSCIHKGQKCIQILWGHQNKNSFCWKTTKNARYVRSLGKIPYFVQQPQRLKHAAQCCAEAQK